MIKRSVRIDNHDTSVSLEQEFWDALHKIAKSKALSINALISQIDKERALDNLSSAIRVFILREVQK